MQDRGGERVMCGNYGRSILNFLFKPEKAMNTSSLFLAGTILGLGSSAALAVPITVNDGQGADSMVIGFSTTDELNYGGNESLQVRSNFKIYLRFDLASLPAGTISDATLTLQNQSNSGTLDFSVWGLSDGYAGGNDFNSDGVNDLDDLWLEGTGAGDDTAAADIDWMNAPGNDSSADAMAASAVYGGTALGTGAADGSSGFTTFSDANLVSYLNANSGNDVVTLVMTSAGSSAFLFRSGEKAGFTPPTLDVTLVPEPMSVALLGVGGALVLAGRRRRGADAWSR